MPVTDEHIETAKAIARDYGATRMVVFGSAVDDPENARDLDLAIEEGDDLGAGREDRTLSRHSCGRDSPRPESVH
jgi:predicted nucleotidyltransferase